MNTKASNRDGLPEIFLAQFGEHVIGFLSGFDRLRFRATLQPLFQPGGLEIYLSSCKVLIKDFSGFAQKLTDRIKEGAYELFRKAGRPIQYLSDSQTSKEVLAQQWSQIMVSARERLCCSPVSNRAYRSISEGIVRPSGYDWSWSTPNARISITIISIPNLG